MTKIREYQQAVYCLFGYRMDRGDVHGQFRLLSMYAASKDDYLLFHVCKYLTWFSLIKIASHKQLCKAASVIIDFFERKCLKVLQLRL